MKFLTDGMLGKLTRWLRMLGYDVKYFRSTEDKQLLKTAKTEHRTLLTCDNELYHQATTQGNAFLVRGATEAEKLANLAKRFNLNLKSTSPFPGARNATQELNPSSKTKLSTEFLKEPYPATMNSGNAQTAHKYTGKELTGIELLIL